MAEPDLVPNAAEPDDELERAFPNAQISHVLTVWSRDQLGAIEVLQLLQDSGARLLAINGARYPDSFQQRLTVTGLGAGEARALAGRVARSGRVQSAQVEHQICRPQD